MIGVMASDYEGVEEVAEEEATWRRDTWWKKKVEGGRREIMDSLFGERLTWKGVGHVASNEWMMRRREDHADQRGEVDG
jgi:hypothetical protein